MSTTRTLVALSEHRAAASPDAAALIDGTPISQLTHLVWPLIVMAVVFIPAGVWVFGKAERYAKRTGKLKRVG